MTWRRPPPVDIVIYKQADKSAKVYFKMIDNGFWIYDCNVATYQATVDWTGATPSLTTPTGTLIWSLSTAPKIGSDASGFAAVNGVPIATTSSTQTLTGKTVNLSSQYPARNDSAVQHRLIG